MFVSLTMMSAAEGAAYYLHAITGRGPVLLRAADIRAARRRMPYSNPSARDWTELHTLEGKVYAVAEPVEAIAAAISAALPPAGLRSMSDHAVMAGVTVRHAHSHQVAGAVAMLPADPPAPRIEG